MSRARRFLVAVASGLILFLAFPDVGWWVTAPIAFAAFYMLLARVSAGGGFGYGWLMGMAFFLPHLWWAFVAVGQVPWVALSAAESIAFGLVGMLFVRLTRSDLLARARWLEPVAFAVLWVGAELLRSAWPFGGFPWGRVAFSAVDSPYAPLAWLGGAPLVSFAVVLTGAVIGAGVLAARNRRVLAPAFAAAVAVGLMVAPMGIPLDGRAQTGTMSVAWVQGNLANKGLDSFDRAREVTANHRDASIELAKQNPGAHIDLVIWPENASDIDPRTDAETAADVTAAAQALGAPIMLGTNDYTPVNGRYNESLVWLPSGKALAGAVYRKQVPAAFAEYIPYRSIVRIFSKEVDLVTSDVLPGKNPSRMEIPIASLGRTVDVGPIICFEVAYDWVSRQAVRDGAEFLAVQTNNATFGVTAESTQQLAMSRLRAIETGRATLQVSTVGVSAVISPTGRVVDRTKLFTRAAGIAQIPLRSSLTPATHWGGLIELGFEILGGLIAVLAIGTSKRRRRS
ncbi:apolipoprotein N-acyltransferase [Demequina lutea]|uniref:Apolipoprotein N-acyltransferase n=1 Tax=Demequina lutea TaxID=431489 RepID=A0A7Z0CI11_9MICO|nr:apolipoprotein N-acyltransferase [Demequina lutea]NYI41399.1 apolipoprotein N-acyltransferase [Demequina lutea]